MTRRRLTYAAITLIIILLIIALLYVNRGERIHADIDAIQTDVLANVTIGQSSRTDIENYMNGQEMDCFTSIVDPSIYKCKTLTRISSWGLRQWWGTIYFYFEDDVLINIEVNESYKGL